MADETVEIAVSGASDDLVEVVGPCYDMGRESDRGEFCDCNIGAGVRQPPKKFALVDGDRRPIAAVYALYDGGWSFALAGSRTMGLTRTGVWWYNGPTSWQRQSQAVCVSVDRQRALFTFGPGNGLCLLCHEDTATAGAACVLTGGETA